MLAVAAAQGLGVALIPPLLIEAEARARRAVVACAQPLRAERSYYLIHPVQAPSTALAAFIQWLQAMAAQWRAQG